MVEVRDVFGGGNAKTCRPRLSDLHRCFFFSGADRWPTHAVRSAGQRRHCYVLSSLLVSCRPSLKRLDLEELNDSLLVLPLELSSRTSQERDFEDQDTESIARVSALIGPPKTSSQSPHPYVLNHVECYQE